MSNFAELVEGIQPKINGNGAQTQDDAWFRTVFLPTIGRFVESRVAPLRQRLKNSNARQSIGNIAAFSNQGRLIARTIL